MSGPNLPDNVTHSDIDKHFGAPRETEEVEYIVTASVDTVVIDADYVSEHELLEQAREQIRAGDVEFIDNVEVVHTEPAP